MLFLASEIDGLIISKKEVSLKCGLSIIAISFLIFIAAHSPYLIGNFARSDTPPS